MAKRIELRGERRITSHHSPFRRPAWSPDGRIALESDVARAAVYVVDAKGRIEGRLVDGREAVWSPDGTRVAYTRTGEDGRRELWVCDAAQPDSGLRLAGGDGAVWEHPAWSPDGLQVACVSDFNNPGGLRHVWVLDAASGGRRRITCDPQRSDGHPAWSPDGKALAFDGDDRADDAREIDIYVLDLRTGTLVCLSEGTVATRRPAFIDRRYVLAERRSVQGPTLVVLDRAKRRTLPVGQAPSGEREPSVRVVLGGKDGGKDKDGGKLKRPVVQVAFVRRSGQTGNDTVWLAELEGLKVVSEVQARKVEEEAVAAEARANLSGLPVLPEQPPGAPFVPRADDTSHLGHDVADDESDGVLAAAELPYAEGERVRRESAEEDEDAEALPPRREDHDHDDEGDSA